MSKMISWLRARSRSQNAPARLSLERVNQNRFYGGGDVENVRFRSLEHYVPKELLKAELYRDRLKKVYVRTTWDTRVVVRRPGTGEVIIVQQTTGEDGETMYIPVDGDQRSSSDSSPLPPVNAEYILHLLLEGDERDAVIGDLLERYAGKHERFGEQRAKLWFYGEVIRSLWPLLKRLVARASGFIAVGEWIRRHVS